jgi:hypothetical protein
LHRCEKVFVNQDLIAHVAIAIGANRLLKLHGAQASQPFLKRVRILIEVSAA